MNPFEQERRTELIVGHAHGIVLLLDMYVRINGAHPVIPDTPSQAALRTAALDGIRQRLAEIRRLQA